MRHVSLARACLAGAMILSAHASVASPLVFGPKAYALTDGKPQTFSETIAVSSANRCGGKASFVLTIQNGGGANGKGVSSGSITLNGKIVISESAFNANVTLIDRPITLLDSNVLLIQLNGGPAGAAISLSIRRIIEEKVFGPVTVQGSSTNSSSFTANNVSSTFYVVGQSSANASIRINGIDVITQADFGADGAFRKLVSLQGTNSIVARVNGNASATLTFEIRRELGETACGPIVRILSPSAGAILNDRQVIVGGTVTGTAGVGVTVNGVAGRVQFDAAGTDSDPFRWIATIEPPEGDVVLDAVATAGDGGIGEDKRSIVFAPDPASITFSVYPASGVVPLTVSFEAQALGDTTQVQIDYDGDGVIDFSGTQPPDPMRFTFNTPGIRVATFQATRADGTVVHGAAAVTAQSFSAMDSLLQQLWNGFADALVAGNVDQALGFLAGDDARERYRGPLNLIRPRLAAFASAVREIHAAYITGRLADYLVIRTENGTAHGYHVYFVPDANGVWKIAQF